ncbi:hypothetical protein THAOC_23841 [Thalassiosira oceanica]|uniref:Uncharacterized protein n=1 Tax=Thalassiosira oceanica TaxID=159749 RepID=K0SC80_THAOC|nr:hypothetical protein THAOC_23841 [Thalassiosira oceanica]|eukprot:EJK56307.1 hypothetical protein THAOC_23841 [Thalassiosira oceanica]
MWIRETSALSLSRVEQRRRGQDRQWAGDLPRRTGGDLDEDDSENDLAIPLAEPVGFQAPHGKHAQSLDMTRSRDEGGERTAAPQAVSADSMGSEEDRNVGANRQQKMASASVPSAFPREVASGKDTRGNAAAVKRRSTTADDRPDVNPGMLLLKGGGRGATDR